MNPFSAISNREHANALAIMFRCLHLGAGRSQSCIEDQLYAMLRLYANMHCESLGNYLDGCHFEAWQDSDGFVPSQEYCYELRDYAEDYRRAQWQLAAGE